MLRKTIKNSKPLNPNISDDQNKKLSALLRKPKKEFE
jgi:hypothetical protein